LRIATTAKLKQVHYVSTTSVVDSRKNVEITIDEDDDLDNLEGLSSGYHQSKWVAEKLIMEARTRGVPCNIYRPGYISGDWNHGIWTTDDFLCR
jgi:thioester reductase-like protein